MKQIAIGFVLGLMTCLTAWSLSAGEAEARTATSASAVTVAEVGTAVRHSVRDADAGSGAASGTVSGGGGGGGCACPGDFDGNNVVNVDDLLVVLNNWGPCSATPIGCCENDCDCDASEVCCAGECAAVGASCDTGDIGVCAAGVIDCVDDELVCVGPGPQPEQCNGLDDDCNGIIDDGNPCPSGFLCCNAQCVDYQNDTFNCGSCNLVCGVGEVCIEGSCASGECTVNEDCDDGNPCIANSCIESRCVDTPVSAGVACDDGDPCTISDACDGTGSCIGQVNPSCCQSHVECDDGDPCTIDLCNGGSCQHSPAPNGTACGANMVCQNGQCIELP